MPVTITTAPEDSMNARCEMFCDRPLGPGDDQPTEDMLGCCSACRVLKRHLTHEVLPAIRRGEGWAAAAHPSDELAARRQARWRPEMLRLLDTLGLRTEA